MAILIIDDCIDTQNLIKVYLTTHFNEPIITALSGDEGISHLSEQIDLILLDVLMPGKDGIATCQEIKQMPAYAHIPVMFITCNKDADILEKVFSAGASDFIKKPFDKMELRVRVRSLLQLSRAMKGWKQREEELKFLSMADGLTGIANRRCFDEIIEREWEVAKKLQTPLSLIMFDIDHFKAYNDEFGHQCGDEVLKAIAHITRKELNKSTEVPTRYGGEEFIIILPNTDVAKAYKIAEKIRKQVGELGFMHREYPICGSTSISLGVAEMQYSGATSIAELIKCADAALYRAKHAGRNCTYLWSAST